MASLYILRHSEFCPILNEASNTVGKLGMIEDCQVANTGAAASDWRKLEVLSTTTSKLSGLLVFEIHTNKHERDFFKH